MMTDATGDRDSSGSTGDTGSHRQHTNVIIETEEGTKTMKTIVSVKGLHKRYQLGKDNF